MLLIFSDAAMEVLLTLLVEELQISPVEAFPSGSLVSSLFCGHYI